MENDVIYNVKGLIILLLFFFLFIQLIRHLFIKSILHFKLLKLIYPKELARIESSFGLMWLLNSNALQFDVMFWFWMPIYYSKIDEQHMSVSVKDLHIRLLQTNRRIFIYSFLYFFYIGFLSIIFNYFI
jgi:hypothetical protein